MSPIHCIPSHWPWSSYLLVSMSNFTFVQVRDIMTRKREKINPSDWDSVKIYSPLVFPLTYMNQDNKDPGKVQPQHFITQSVVLLLVGRAKEGECEVIWDENLTLPKWLGSEVKSVPSIQYNIVSQQHNVKCTQHIMIWSVCYITINNMPCLSHNKTRKRLSINRARYNKVKSQHNITIQKHKMNLAQLIMTWWQYNVII